MAKHFDIELRKVGSHAAIDVDAYECVRDLDTGAVVKPGGYPLTDKTYAKLLAELTKHPARPIPVQLKHDIPIGRGLVGAADEIGFNRYRILNLHALLANNLLADLQAAGISLPRPTPRDTGKIAALTLGSVVLVSILIRLWSR